ncbi:phosphoribosylaminoimidazole-succinocarboxamide [Stemphylium lycopersici]|nr:phosphoribosylaminoimidazole-succinocarboxamide [Stemphylium lycopersici]RAR07548.1 phosphoribosylaminoimidazole-succinocarboxamide [Stemphylium lycopersici]
MSVEPGFQLKQTNGGHILPEHLQDTHLTDSTPVSQPQLSHQSSKQSVAASLTASEGYYSASDHASSSSEERRPFYRTPPSHHQTPTQSHEQLVPHTDIPITSLRGVGIPRQQPPPPQPSFTHERPQSPAVSTIAEESRPETRDARRSQLLSGMDNESQVTTPGQDTTPYIRFAIDQLTRDEDVRGSRIYPEVRPTAQDEDDEDYPVERIIPDNGLGYMAQEQRTQHRMSQHMPARKPLRQSSTPLAAAPAPMATQPHRPQHQSQQYRQQHSPSPPRNQKDVFVAHNQPSAPLHFLPAILRPLWLGLFISLCLVMLAALIFTAVYSDRDGGYGLWDYGAFGDSRYFVFQYLPTLLGTLMFLWLIQIQAALQRLVPFISMSSDSFKQRSEAVFLRLYPMQFLWPNFQHFRAGHPGVGAFFVISWLFTWTIPLLASSFNVRYDLGRGVWRWIAVQGVIWTVVALYILQVIALVYLTMFLMRNPTGLKWDPRSLADMITLLERANNLGDYNNSETFERDDWHLVSNRADRIGYWSTTRRPNDIFYGIGEEGAEIRKFSIEEGRIREQGPKPDAAQANDFSIRMDIRSPSVRLRFLPWYLKDTSVIAWIVIAWVLLIAFLVVSFVNSAVSLGFLPRVYARTGADGFSASNFLYSFIPAVIGHFLFLAILSLDYSLRVLQPYKALASKGGATAEASLLVDYACRMPFSATLAALENKHFQTATLSFVSLASMSLPILAGGCFWTQYYGSEDTVRVAAELSGYYALCFFLALYTVSLFALLPGRRRAALPHRSNSLCEIISWVYQSPILTDRAFARPQTKPDLVARLMGTTYAERTWARSVASLVRPSRNNLRGDSPTDPALTEKTKKDRKHDKHDSVTDPGQVRYGFGIHVGRDGLEHLGIDRVRRGGNRSGRELVIWEEQQTDSKRKSWTSQV